MAQLNAIYFENTFVLNNPKDIYLAAKTVQLYMQTLARRLHQVIIESDDPNVCVSSIKLGIKIGKEIQRLKDLKDLNSELGDLSRCIDDCELNILKADRITKAFNLIMEIFRGDIHRHHMHRLNLFLN